MSSELEGTTGQVTGRVAPGATGEVTVSIRGGSEKFFAYSTDGTEVIEVNRMATIVQFSPPRTVFVTAARN